MNALDTHNARILIVEDDSSYLERILSRFQKYINLRFEQLEGKTVCAADVLKAPEPAFLISLKDRNLKEFYIRPGNQTESLDMEQMYRHLRMKKWF
jgi:hypothetical protein